MKLKTKGRQAVWEKRGTRRRISDMFTSYLEAGGTLPAVVCAPFALPEQRYRGMAVQVDASFPTVFIQPTSLR